MGLDPEADSDQRLRARLLVAISTLIAVAGLFWGLAYILFGEAGAARIPLTYSALTVLNLGLFALTRRYEAFRLVQLLLTLLLPFLLMLALGGFVNSSAVILWAILAPLGALLLAGRREAVYWFVAYAGFVTVSRFIQPSLGVESDLGTGVIVTFFVLNIVGVSAVVFLVLNYFVGQKDAAMDLLDQEREKSDRLLLNMLPPRVADQLKAREGTIARHHPAVSVMFIDIVGFTPMSERLDPTEMVDLLNAIFSHFDSLAAEYGVEKIRTIGDNYMVASGVPDSRPDHAHALARVALRMNEREWREDLPGGRVPSFRLGINSGPVIAGVIGESKFQYDLWGDTVNTASRMESHGVPGRIQITSATYDLISDSFQCDRRGSIDVKGKGEMDTWFLEAEVTDSDSKAPGPIATATRDQP